MAFGTMPEHRKMWKAQREAQGQPVTDEDWTQWLFDRWREQESEIARMKLAASGDRLRVAG